MKPMTKETRKLDRKEKNVEASFHEQIEELFSVNFLCPHCKKSLNISLASLKLERIK